MDTTQTFLKLMRTYEDQAGFSASFLKRLTDRQLFKVLADTRRLLTKSNPVFGKPLPRDYTELCDWSTVYESPNKSSDVLLLAGQISAYSETINRFIQLETEFNRKLLNKNYADASLVLEKLESELGVSLWLLEKKISLLELEKGVDAQKAFAQALRKNEALPQPLRTLIYFYSLKAEKAVPPERYDLMLDATFPKNSSGDASSFAYMRFHLGYFDSDFFAADMILGFEQGSSIIDRYLTFIRLGQLAAVDIRYAEYVSPYKRALNNIGIKIYDCRFENLSLRLLGGLKVSKGYKTASVDNGLGFLKILDNYTSGDYENVIANIESVHGQEYGALLDVYCRAIARGKNKALPSSYMLVATEYNSLIEKNKQCLESASYILKLIYMFPSAPWAAELYAQLCRETNANGKPQFSYIVEWGELNGSPFSPRLLSRLSQHTIKRENADKEATNCSLTYKFLTIGRNNGSFEFFKKLVPENRIQKYLAKAEIEAGNSSAAEKILKDIILHGDVIDKQDGVTTLIALYLDSGQFEEAAMLASTTLANQPQMHVIIPLGEILVTYENRRDYGKSVYPSMYMAACYGLYNELYDDDRQEQITIVCEEFLSGKGINRPSELKQGQSAYEKFVLTYFLYAVCRQDILDSHIAYLDSVEIENERVSILQWLIELNEDNRSKYADEIAQITQRQMIRQGVRTVETSKIYVDINGIKNSVIKDFSEIYTRFLSLPDFPHLPELVLQLKKDAEKSGLFAVVLPMNERKAALRQLYVLVRDRFVSSNEHGLDVYLSVGIRHGTLSGQLRSVLERVNLVTQKNENGEYARNDYWASQLDFSDEQDETLRIDTALSEFSAQVDKLIAMLRDSWIQVRTEDKNQDGLFDYVITTEDVSVLTSQIGQETTVTEALDIVLESLWQKTDDSLKAVHEKLSTVYKQSFSAAFDTCISAVAEISSWPSTQKLRSALAMARTAMQNEIDNIATWFTRTTESSVPSYDFSFAVSVATEMVARCYPQHSLQLERHSEGHSQMSGRTLKGTVDLLFIIFDNLLKHCGKSNGEVEARMHHIVTPNSMKLALYSPVFREIDTARENEALSTRLREVLSKNTNDRVRREGGSGFHKIAKIARVDFQSTMDMWFGYISAKEFEFTLTLTNGRLFDENTRR